MGKRHSKKVNVAGEDEYSLQFIEELLRHLTVAYSAYLEKMKYVEDFHRTMAYIMLLQHIKTKMQFQQISDDEKAQLVNSLPLINGLIGRFEFLNG